MKERGPGFLRRLIIDARGTERDVTPPERNSFPDKKRVNISPERIEQAVRDIAEINKAAEVGQHEAVWLPAMDYPSRPMLFLFLTDVHYTSTRADSDILNHYLDIVDKTPNMFLVTGGDDTDNANVNLGKVATLMYEDPIRADLQGSAWANKLEKLDRKSKIGFMVFGNHTDWTFHAGVDWYNTFLGRMHCPILTSGGLIRVQFDKGARYDIAATHRYWGASKLNPTNTAKRYLEHEYPSADVILLGHCFSSDTEVLTKKGWMTFDKVVVGDSVMTRNLANGCSEWNVVNKTFKYSHYKQLVHFKNRDTDLLVTPEHAVISSANHLFFPYKRVEAYKRIGKRTNMPVGGKNKQKDVNVSDDWLRLVAWIITEGSYSADSVGHIRISQSNKKKVGVKHIVDICERLNLEFSVIKRYSAGKTQHGQHRNYDAFRINIHSCKTTRYIEKLFPNKRISDWFWNLSKRQFDIFFKEIILADGNKNSMGRGYQYSSKWEDEIDNLQALCSMNGYRTSKIKRIHRLGNTYYVLTINPRSCITIMDGGKYKQYSGDVYCVSVDNQTLFVRRSGKVVVSGNTHQSESLTFERGGKERIAVIGGTLKLYEDYARKHGIGGRAGTPGQCIALWPGKQEMQAYKNFDRAVAEHMRRL